VILSDGEIQEAIARKFIIIEPIPTEEQYTTSALDLSLGQELFELKTPEEMAKEEPRGVERSFVINLAEIDIKSFQAKYTRPLAPEPDGSFIWHPRKFILTMTKEYVELPRQSRIAARVEGRSTLARLGLIVHLTAPTIHAGFSGYITLEMFNLGPYSVRLSPGIAICQLVFERLRRVPKGPVRTAFQGQTGIRS
jgi:dCTP deaminase